MTKLTKIGLLCFAILILGSIGCTSKNKIRTIQILDLTQQVTPTILLTKNTNQLLFVYNQNRIALKNQLGDQFKNISNDEEKLIFASFLAYQLKPYGQSSSATLEQFLQNDYANCGTYPTATYDIYLLLSPDKPLKINFVGWNNGAVGNHAQMFVDDTVPLLIDPTIGLVAIATFDEVASGKSISSQSIASMFKLKEKDPPSLSSFNTKVITALQKGLYKPSDLLYYFGNYAELTKKDACGSNWATPQTLPIKQLLCNVSSQ